MPDSLRIVSVFHKRSKGIVFVNLLPLLRQRKLLKGVRNYDAGLHRFLFRIDMTLEEFWNRLRRPNAADVLEYDLSDDASVITFRRYKGRLSCRLRPEAHGAYIIFRLETAQHPFVQTGGAQFYVNSFRIQKFGAVPLDFCQYERRPFGRRSDCQKSP